MLTSSQIFEGAVAGCASTHIEIIETAELPVSLVVI